MEIIRYCWSGEPFYFHGEYHQLENLHIRPSPFQQPAPPLWIGASVPAGARRAGRMADGFVAGPSTNLANTIELVETYREAAVREGKGAAGGPDAGRLGGRYPRRSRGGVRAARR